MLDQWELDMREATKRRAFTMIELMIVVGVIAILASLTLLIGKRMVDNGRRQATEDVLHTLDMALQAYTSDGKVDGRVPTYVTIAGKAWPMSDVRDMTNTVSAADAARFGVKPGNQMINSVGLFIAMVQASDNEAAKAELGHLPSKFTGLYDPDGDGADSQPELMTAFDAWGKPIRMVHPALDGIQKLNNGFVQAAPTAMWGTQQIRRDFGWSVSSQVNAQDVGDSDAGQCEGATPYFYSVGPDAGAGYDGGVASPSPDARPATDYDADNVYTRKPKLPNARKTASP